MLRQARDIMNRDVISVPTTMDLRDLAKMFLEQGITGAPVVDDQGDLAGVVSQTDLIYYGLTRDDELVLDSLFYQTARMEGHHIPRGFQIEDCNTGVVGDVMTPLVHSVTERASLQSVTRLMTRKHIHRVIVRKGRKVAGIISALDVLRAHVDGGSNSSPKSPRASASKTSAKKLRPAHKSKQRAKPKAKQKSKRASKRISKKTPAGRTSRKRVRAR